MERSQSNSETEKGVIMAGLYGDWDVMGQGVDEAQAEGASALEGEPKKKKKKKRKVIKGEDYAKTKEHKKGKKFYQRRDFPYEGRKSDLAWIAAQEKKKNK